MPHALTHHRARVAMLSLGGFAGIRYPRRWWPGRTWLTVRPSDHLPTITIRTRRPDRVLDELRGATSAADLRRRAAYAGGPYPDTEES